MNFDTCRKQSPEAFIRLTGVSKVIFQRLLKDLETAFKKDKDAKPITKRGLKAAFSIEDQLLLTGAFIN